MLYVISGKYFETNNNKMSIKEEYELQRRLIEYVTGHRIDSSEIFIQHFRLNSRNLKEAVKRFCNELLETDVVIMWSLLDIGRMPRICLPLLEYMFQQDCQIYIYSISMNEPFRKYRKKLYDCYNYNPNTKGKVKYTRKPKYDPELLEFCAHLRSIRPPVKLAEIEKYTGLKASTIIEYMKRTQAPLPGNDNPRLIKKGEIDMINRIKNRGLTNNMSEPF